jgi:hypothetical protein
MLKPLCKRDGHNYVIPRGRPCAITLQDAWQEGTLMTMRMTLPDAETRAQVLATGTDQGMEASERGSRRR